MSEYKVGGFAKSTAGHDSGKYYVIIKIDQEYVYLVDGKIRSLNNMKKKKIKHMEVLEEFDQTLLDKVINLNVSNEEIKRAIKLLKQTDSN